MSQHNKKDIVSHASSTRQRKQQQQQDEGKIKINTNTKSNNNSSTNSSTGSNKSQKKLSPNGSATKGNSSNTNSSNSNTSFSNSNSNKLQTHTKPNSGGSHRMQLSKKDKQQKDKERIERAQLVLWRRPMQTSKYCALELIALLRSWSSSLLKQRSMLAVLIVIGIVFNIIYKIDGPHQMIIELVRRNTWFFVYWLGLGVLSSVGLGTGLHTFLLYLGPHIASVTLAGYECNTLDFPQPPYPDDIICPEEPYLKRMPNIWSIMSKVRLEAFLWGAGTALGELPPYFMAKAARLSGYDPEDAEELAEFEALNAKRHQKNLSLMDKGKLFMERVVERVGFFGILACASIPNPLFDLAGITCGHFLVPFWTFFGATLIGKAIIKMHIQKIFVIIAFNETLIERAVDLLATMPVFGRKLQQPFKAFLENQKQRLHRQQRGRTASGGAGADSGNLISKIFETFVIGMVCYFVVSIVNSLAQSYHKRLHKKHRNVAPATPIVSGSGGGGGMKKHKQKALRE